MGKYDPDEPCRVEECSKPRVPRRPMCSMHIARLRRLGTADVRPGCHGTLAERFWRLVVQNEEGCWAWPGAKSNYGYGSIRHEGKARGAHRVSWELHFGPIPAGMEVMHSCDNPECTRPDHLSLGTHRDNMLDAWHKQRIPRDQAVKGEDHYNARLTESDVIAMRAQYAAGVRPAALARRYDVSSSTAERIVRRLTWRHVA